MLLEVLCSPRRSNCATFPAKEFLIPFLSACYFENDLNSYSFILFFPLLYFNFLSLGAMIGILAALWKVV